MQGTECRADQAVAGYHREAGIPAGEQGLGRQAEQTRAAGTLAAATGFEARKVKVFRAFMVTAVRDGSRARRAPAENHGSLRATSAVEHLRSEEHTSELQSLMRISYAVFFLKTHKNTLRILRNNH